MQSMWVKDPTMANFLVFVMSMPQPDGPLAM